MKQNVTFSVGSIAAIDKIDLETDFFQGILGGLSGRAKTFIPCIKLLIVDKMQFVDFSSSYFEGKNCPRGELGYSRDGQPGKQQFTFRPDFRKASLN